MSKDIRIGVIGVGRLGSIHSRTYVSIPGIKLVGVCDTDTRRATEAALLYQGCQPYHDYRRLIEEVDALSIATPTEAHYEIAKVALEAGKHLLIEKPITTTLQEADELLTLADEKGVVLQVGHIERFNSALQAVVQQGKPPRFIECDRLGPFSPRVANVGVVIDLMIHDIDIVLSLVRSPIASIDAVGLKVLTSHEDIANARIRFKNGAVANLTASRVTPETLRKIRIFQEDAYLSLDYVKQELVIHRKVGNQIQSENHPIQKEEPIRKELTSFIECIQNGRKPIVSGREAREALAVALEIVRQIHEK
jgi:predicted dehydrogenase